MEGSYIDSTRLFESLSNTFTVLTDVMDLRKTMLAATAIDQSGKVKLSFKGNELVMTTTGEGGNGTSSLKVIPLTGTPQGVYWYQANKLSACLAALTEAVALGVAQSGILTLSTEGTFYMQNGLRVTASAAKAPKRKAA